MTKLSSSSSFSQMAPSILLVFILGMAGCSDAAWCVCKPDASSTALQRAIDYACGAGADCNPIHQNGPCYNPNTIVGHCSYAANSYYQRKGQNQQACDFSGTAQVSSSDPSQPGCPFPATSSAAGSSSTTPGTTPATPGTPTVTPATPGTPTLTPTTPGTPTLTPATPGTPTLTPTTPGTPTLTPTTPGAPTMTPATPGSSGTTPIGGDGTTFDPNTPTTAGGSTSFGMGPSPVGFDNSLAPPTHFLSIPFILFLLLPTIAMFNF